MGKDTSFICTGLEFKFPELIEKAGMAACLLITLALWGWKWEDRWGLLNTNLAPGSVKIGISSPFNGYSD